VRLGLVGYGRWGKVVARALARVGDLIAICDTWEERATAATRDWEDWGVRSTVFHDDLVGVCDAVWIATPTVDHAATIRFYLDQGIHVLAEKPVVTDLDVAADLVDLARKRGVLLMGGFLGIHTGCHGELLASPRPRELEIVRRNTRPSLSDGDVLWGLGPHDVASVIAVMGSRPNVVSATGGVHYCQVEMIWNEGYPARVSIELDWLAEERARRVIRNRDFSVNLADTPNRVEPLLREAREFVGRIGLGPAEHAEELQRIIDVTSTLARAQATLS